jgi:hypothetical protein
MNIETFKFQGWKAALNVLLLMVFVWFLHIVLPMAIKDLSNFEKIDDLYLPVFCAVLIWLIICEFGYNFLLYFPSGVAFELHDSCIKVCTPFGLKEIPKKAVLGCKKPIHRMSGGPKSGLVIVSVTPKYRVIGPHLFKVNPRFHGASILNEDEQSVVKKIRAWRKVNDS